MEFNITQIRHTIPAYLVQVHILCTHKWHTKSLPGWGLLELALYGCSKSLIFWDNNKHQGSWGNFWDIIGISWTRSFAVRVTESGPIWRDHSIPLLQNKIMLLYCRLEMYRMRMQMNFWLLVSTNGESTRLCHNWIFFCFFGLRFWCAWLRFEEISSKMELVFLFRNRDPIFLQNNLYHLHQIK